MKRAFLMLAIASQFATMLGQCGSHMGGFFFFDQYINPGEATDVHEIVNELAASGTHVIVDSTKGGRGGAGLFLVINDWTFDMALSTAPTDAAGNYAFKTKYALLPNNTSISHDSLEVYLTFFHSRMGIGRLFKCHGPMFIAPSLSFDREVGRMLLKDSLFQAFNLNNHYGMTTAHNGIQLRDLTQDKSTINGVSLTLRSGFVLGENWEKGSMFVSINPGFKYGWRVNKNMDGVVDRDKGRWSAYVSLSVGYGMIRSE